MALLTNIVAANRKIKKLCASLGRPPGDPVWNIGKAHALIEKLEAQLAPNAKVRPHTVKPITLKASLEILAATPPPHYSAAALATPPPPPATAVETGLAPWKLATLAAHIFGNSAAADFEGQRRQFTDAGLLVPGMAPAATNPHFKVTFTGLARTVRADRQDKIAAFFKKTSVPAPKVSPSATGTVETGIPATQLAALSAHIFGTSAAADFEGRRRQFTAAGLTVPGLAPAAPNPHFQANFTGIARIVRGARQEKIAAFFAKK